MLSDRSVEAIHGIRRTAVAVARMPSLRPAALGRKVELPRHASHAPNAAAHRPAGTPGQHHRSDRECVGPQGGRHGILGHRRADVTVATNPVCLPTYGDTCVCKFRDAIVCACGSPVPYVRRIHLDRPRRPAGMPACALPLQAVLLFVHAGISWLVVKVRL